MKQIPDSYKKALDGTLRSTNGDNFDPIISVGTSGQYFYAYYIDKNGNLVDDENSPFELYKEQTWSNDYMHDGACFYVVNQLTKSFVGVIELDKGIKKYVVDCLPANLSGKPPVASGDTIIPANSKKITVGMGEITNPNSKNSPLTVVHEQFWRRSHDSVSLAPGESKEYSVTTFEGVEQSSSESTEVAAAISTSVSGGWGVVSASINASLSKSITRTSETSLRDETTKYESYTLTNNIEDNVTKMYIIWQLIDVFTISSSGNNIENELVINSAQAPCIMSITEC